MIFENPKFVENQFTVSFTGDLQKIQCLVEEDPDEENAKAAELAKDPAFNEVREALLSTLKKSFLGQLETDEVSSDEEDDDDEEEDDEEEDLSEKWDEDAADEEETYEGSPPIEQAKVYYFSGSDDETNHFGLLVMDEGVAMGDVVNFDENVPSIQFQHFGFQNNHQIIELPVMQKLVFS